MDQNSFEDLYSQFVQAAKQAQQQRATRLEDLLGSLGGWEANGQRLGGLGNQLGGQGFFNQAPPKWSNLAEMNAYIKAHPPKAKPKPIDKATRIRQIEEELDIIRGRVPTPKGYKVDATKVKDLMIELRKLKSDG